MAKKNECYLCGGKLRGGYCPDCGLDNTKIRKKHYHLNESYAVESMNGDESQASEPCDHKAGQDTWDKSSFDTEKKDKKENKKNKKDISQQGKGSPGQKYSYQFQNKKFRNTGENTVQRKLRSGRAKVGATLFLLALFVIKVGKDYIDENGLYFGSLREPEYEAEYVGPYEYAERELSETGEHYETELGQGEYLVGVHLPEGSYTAELLDGRGGLSLEDMENGIYIWQAFGTQAEYDELQVLEDVRLYKGAHVTIKEAMLLRLTTENGQTDDMEFVENPLTESVSLEKDETLEAGEDIVPGVYDLHAVISEKSDWGTLRCRISDDAYEDGYYEVSYWLSGEEMDDTYRNLYLREDTEITAEDISIELTPSEVIGTGDYEEYYQHY
ncbi:MAG: hypothetical protein K1W40_21015 [Schaedlerella sp.]|uniref:hypothetical protein n=1 Tax=Schaedlerella sp. TaxID=2676057 RepID=UPI00265F5247|nr:hypothetical protein [uncultured Schaedlerella sp.]